MRFVKLLPSHMTDARTYNMLVSVCIAARDLPMALQAGMMLRSTGRNLDTFLYTSLITGTPAVCAITSNSNHGDAKQNNCLQKTIMPRTSKYASVAGFSLIKCPEGSSTQQTCCHCLAVNLSGCHQLLRRPVRSSCGCRAGLVLWSVAAVCSRVMKHRAAHVAWQ